MGKGSKELDNQIDYQVYEKLIKLDRSVKNNLLQTLCPGDTMATICKYFNLKNVEVRMFTNCGHRDRKNTRLNSSHPVSSRMPSSA